MQTGSQLLASRLTSRERQSQRLQEAGESSLSPLPLILSGSPVLVA